jgi:hypothetical protein
VKSGAHHKTQDLSHCFAIRKQLIKVVECSNKASLWYKSARDFLEFLHQTSTSNICLKLNKLLQTLQSFRTSPSSKHLRQQWVSLIFSTSALPKPRSFRPLNFIAEPPNMSPLLSTEITLLSAATVEFGTRALSVGLGVPMILSLPVNVYSHLHVKLIQKRNFSWQWDFTVLLADLKFVSRLVLGFALNFRSVRNKLLKPWLVLM